MRLAIRLQGIPDRIIDVGLAVRVHVVQVLGIALQHRQRARGVWAVVAHNEQPLALAYAAVRRRHGAYQPLAQQRKAGFAAARRLGDKPEIDSRCRTPLMVTGRLNSSLTLNSFISSPIAESA